VCGIVLCPKQSGRAGSEVVPFRSAMVSVPLRSIVEHKASRPCSSIILREQRSRLVSCRGFVEDFILKPLTTAGQVCETSLSRILLPISTLADMCDRMLILWHFMSCVASHPARSVVSFLAHSEGCGFSSSTFRTRRINSMQNPVLNEGIRTFYDQSSGLWEDVWGEHMHHGFYEKGGGDKKSRVGAQIDMIENLLDFAGVERASRMVDVGCGIGGSSRFSPIN
jgi:hypothetical protein